MAMDVFSEEGNKQKNTEPKLSLRFECRTDLIELKFYAV